MELWHRSATDWGPVGISKLVICYISSMFELMNLHLTNCNVNWISVFHSRRAMFVSKTDSYAILVAYGRVL